MRPIAPPPMRLNEWTVEQVVRWVSTIPLAPEVENILLDNAINGAVLESLSEQDLLAMGIEKFGWRRQLLLSRRGLQQHLEEARTHRPSDETEHYELASEVWSSRAASPRLASSLTPRSGGARHIQFGALSLGFDKGGTLGSLAGESEDGAVDSQPYTLPSENSVERSLSPVANSPVRRRHQNGAGRLPVELQRGARTPGVQAATAVAGSLPPSPERRTLRAAASQRVLCPRKWSHSPRSTVPVQGMRPLLRHPLATRARSSIVCGMMPSTRAAPALEAAAYGATLRSKVSVACAPCPTTAAPSSPQGTSPSQLGVMRRSRRAYVRASSAMALGPGGGSASIPAGVRVRSASPPPVLSPGVAWPWPSAAPATSPGRALSSWTARLSADGEAAPRLGGSLSLAICSGQAARMSSRQALA